MEDESGVISYLIHVITILFFNLYFCFRNSSNSHVTYKLYTMPTARNPSRGENLEILSFRKTCIPFSALHAGFFSHGNRKYFPLIDHL